jgi:hypothetical protein
MRSGNEEEFSWMDWGMDALGSEVCQHEDRLRGAFHDLSDHSWSFQSHSVAFLHHG